MFPASRLVTNSVSLIPAHHLLIRNCSSGPKTKIQQAGKAVSGGIKQYVLTKYVNYVGGYQKVLETRFPKAMKVYRVFSVGVKDFYQDSKDFVRVKGLARAARKHGLGINSLSYKDLDTFYRVPREMFRVAPVLIIGALPLAQYLIFPLAYCLPKLLLSSHFWSLQQRHDFALQDHRKAVQSFRPTFRSMQARIASVEDEALREKLSGILAKLASGVHPTISEIAAIKVLFQDEPFHLNCLYSPHKNHLLKVHHGTFPLLFQRHRLSSRAQEILNKDYALRREGVSSLSLDELRSACFTRGLNPTSMRTEDMTKWLSKWLSVSSDVDSSTYSLLLHCPILLAYNHPTNRVLIQ